MTEDSGDPVAGERSWSIMFDLWLLQQAIFPLVEQFISSTGLSASDYGMYLLLDEFGPIAPSDIARVTGMQSHTITTAIKNMEARGHLSRLPHETDRRSVLLELSAEGKAIVRTAGTGHSKLLEGLLARVDGAECQRSVVEIGDAVRDIANLPSRRSLG